MENQIKKTIATKIIRLYNFHNYEISKSHLTKLASIIFESKKNVKNDEIDKFFNLVEKGEFGTLFSQPTCLTSMYNNFLKKYTQKMVY